ncbi:helix-turn-helix domain-containing protein [Psychrobacillus sp. FSL K6-1464]|uniref:helix-turn-helix domain-containing protein n=1 Tax=Psychrobacillus sp. FSL K6-1464 TaxID=2921545 RepID=UPI0030F4F3F4
MQDYDNRGVKVEDLGRKVSYYRRSKGLSIKALAENVCNESTIHRLEKGKQLPRLEILNDICLKLEISFKALFPLNEEVEELKSLCREFTYRNDYLSLELTLNKCKEVLEGISSIYLKEEFRKFIQWHRAVLLHKTENKIDDALCILNKLVSIKNFGSELDISILNSIGLIYLSSNNVEAALKIYSVINEKLMNQRIYEDFTLIPRVRYNYAYTLYKLDCFEEALEVTYEILHYMKARQLMYSLGKVYHMIGILSKKCGLLDEAEEAFNNAILVFTLTKDQQNLNVAKIDLSNL